MFELGYNVAETTKKHLLCKSKGAIDDSTVSGGLKKQFARVTRTLMIRQGQIDIKPWIPRPCSGNWHSNSAALLSHSQVWFVTFTPSIKVSGVDITKILQNIAGHIA